MNSKLPKSQSLKLLQQNLLDPEQLKSVSDVEKKLLKDIKGAQSIEYTDETWEYMMEDNDFNMDELW